MTTRRAQGYLLNANIVREKAYGEFRGQRLEANPPKVELHASCKENQEEKSDRDYSKSGKRFFW